MNRPAFRQAIDSRARRAHPQTRVRCQGNGRNQILQLHHRRPRRPVEFFRRAHEQTAPIKPEPGASLRTKRQTNRRATRQPDAAVKDAHIARLQPDQPAAEGAEPEIAFAIFAQRAHVAGKSAVTQRDGQKVVVGEAVQSLPAGADPQLAMAALAQAPDAQRRKIFTAAKMVEVFSVGEIHEIRVAERPELAGAIFIHAE